MAPWFDPWFVGAPLAICTMEIIGAFALARRLMLMIRFGGGLGAWFFPDAPTPVTLDGDRIFPNNDPYPTPLVL